MAGNIAIGNNAGRDISIDENVLIIGDDVYKPIENENTILIDRSNQTTICIGRNLFGKPNPIYDFVSKTINIKVGKR